MQQLLIIDNNGKLLHSDDTLFKTVTYKDKSVFEISVFVESIFALLKNIEPKEIYEYEIESDIPFIKGLHTYTFQKSKYENQEVIFWKIRDISHSLEEIKVYQQKYNEAEIERHLNS
ncbi:MAG: hypothetical protein IPL95_04050 [Saprospiraceae bacterium]|nr:hypothetical protein [Saprospiraceae bacterium]